MEIALMPISGALPSDSKIIFTKPIEGLSSNIKISFLPRTSSSAIGYKIKIGEKIANKIEKFLFLLALF